MGDLPNMKIDTFKRDAKGQKGKKNGQKVEKLMHEKTQQGANANRAGTRSCQNKKANKLKHGKAKRCHKFAV